MTTALKEIMERAEQLDPEAQEDIARELRELVAAFEMLPYARRRELITAINKLIVTAVTDRQWEQAFEDQRGLDALHRMALEAIAEHERGETEEGGFGEE